MPLRIKHIRQEEAPKPSSTGKANKDLFAVKSEMLKLGKGMVLEIETGSERAVRGAKTLVTRASKELGARWQHWHVGTKVFAKPVQTPKNTTSGRKKTG
ncbi:MAG TPA: hypothetical protein VIP09_10830 [Dehalococcoidia bacterium]|jgi:hypothetical protein